MTQLNNPLWKLLDSIYACPAAIRWSRKYGRNWRKAWRECHRGDWLAWLCYALRVRSKRYLSPYAARMGFAKWAGIDGEAVSAALDAGGTIHPVSPGHTRNLRHALRLGADLVRCNINEDDVGAALRGLDR